MSDKGFGLSADQKSDPHGGMSFIKTEKNYLQAYKCQK